jgi:hypothetical protein
MHFVRSLGAWVMPRIAVLTLRLALGDTDENKNEVKNK